MTKRTFFRTVGAGISAVRLAASQSVSALQKNPGRFAPVDCRRSFNASARDLGPHDRAVELGGASAGDKLIRAPSGDRTLRGIPFALAPEGVSNKKWIVVSPSQQRVVVPIGASAGFVCLAQFCDWDPTELAPAGVDAFEAVGQTLADAVLVHEDGTETRTPIRRRFEVNSLTHPWGHDCFAAVPHRRFMAASLNDALPGAMTWGLLQTVVKTEPGAGGPGTLWLASIANPRPDLPIRSLALESRAPGFLAVAGITLYRGREDPLRQDNVALLQFRLPAGESGEDWEMAIDLGVVARTYRLPEFDGDTWLATPVVGLGEPRSPLREDVLYAEIVASPEATLTLRNRRTRTEARYAIGDIQAGRRAGSGPRAEVIETGKAWIRGRVLDESTGTPAPVRIAFRSRDGRYIPPYGHRTEVNGAWFQDYGADLRAGQSSFAYIDGEFQIELPTGDVFVEIVKGFEYEPVRKKLTIVAGQNSLDLTISRFDDLRRANWVSADSHVHFLSPSTALLEAEAEGLNLIHLLAAQWAGLFTNVGDFRHGNLTSPDGGAMVVMGTENRQHLLGHLALLGGQGRPVFPMSADGPMEANLGQVLSHALADWADGCHERGGLVVAAHFPYPTAELAADIVLDKIDAVEMQPREIGEHFRSFRFMEWYRYLNCGYRLPALGGTDKMNASMIAGSFRGYVHLGDREFTFPNWAEAVRRGNTFMTSGPLLLFEADGRMPGSEIAIGSAEGRIEVQARVRSTVPVHRVEIVANGRVVASREDAAGTREIVLREAVSVQAPGWIAARCSSRTSVGGIQVAAHTSPVYLTSPGKDLFSAPVASYLLTLLDGSEAWVNRLAIRPDEDRLARVLAVFASARERLHQRMHRHGIPH
ncbi:MAG: CehA/McbA family metallohydrolase [Bryobacterales bacterium]|nr:CehA/McbA family metallohydrolase [Bryobacterales bacterium]